MKTEQSMSIVAATLVLGWIIVGLSGCAAFEAESNAQRLVAIDAQFTAIVDTASDLRKRGELTDEQMRKLNEHFQEADQALDVAWEAHALGNDGTVVQRLQQLRVILNGVQDIMREEDTNET